MEIQEQEILHSNLTRYQVLNFNGEGCFGKVATCLDLSTGEKVAVKIHKDNQVNAVKQEVEMLRAVNENGDPEQTHIVRFIDGFMCKKSSCLVFEKLDKSLWDIMKERPRMKLSLCEIRIIAEQLFLAFSYLKELKIIHTDVKPDNVMLVNQREKPYHIKLIDFGLALPESQAKLGMLMQPVSFRAPEVTLGLPLTTAVDMWSVGCLMANMYFGREIFPRNCPYNWMKVMCHLLGNPEEQLLTEAINSWKYFELEFNHNDPQWKLRDPADYVDMTGCTPVLREEFFRYTGNLEYEVLQRNPSQDPAENKDRIAFLDLLKGCLQVDPAKRLTPNEAFSHAFITMSHLDDFDDSEYADNAAAIYKDYLGVPDECESRSLKTTSEREHETHQSSSSSKYCFDNHGAILSSAEHTDHSKEVNGCDTEGKSSIMKSIIRDTTIPSCTSDAMKPKSSSCDQRDPPVSTLNNQTTSAVPPTNKETESTDVTTLIEEQPGSTSSGFHDDFKPLRSKEKSMGDTTILSCTNDAMRPKSVSTSNNQTSAVPLIDKDTEITNITTLIEAQPGSTTECLKPADEIKSQVAMLNEIAAASVSPSDLPAAVTSTTDATDRPKKRKSLGHKVRRFFRRVGKGIKSIFVCGKAED